MRGFLHFMRSIAPGADDLYILGDLFEYWAGDDDTADPFHGQIIGALHALSLTGTRISIMHGNRDLLMGQELAKLSGATLISDPTLINLHGTQTLLTHGDTLCTDDVAYQNYRAQVGDDVWVSGLLGDAALALAHVQGSVQLATQDLEGCMAALQQPVPRVALGLALRDLASSAIDVSDGLLADLGHILESSRVGASILFSALPCSRALKLHLRKPIGKRCLLAGGDDYELCFTVSEIHRTKIDKISSDLGLPLTRVGVITKGALCMVLAADGEIIDTQDSGYDHFR